jgi:hypothetical protein
MKYKILKFDSDYTAAEIEREVNKNAAFGWTWKDISMSKHQTLVILEKPADHISQINKERAEKGAWYDH